MTLDAVRKEIVRMRDVALATAEDAGSQSWFNAYHLGVAGSCNQLLSKMGLPIPQAAALPREELCKPKKIENAPTGLRSVDMARARSAASKRTHWELQSYQYRPGAVTFTAHDEMVQESDFIILQLLEMELRGKRAQSLKNTRKDRASVGLKRLGRFFKWK